MNRLYQITIVCFAFILFSLSAQASFKINGTNSNFKSQVNFVQLINKNQDKQEQDKKDQKDKPKAQTTGKATDIVMVPKARKQSRPKVVKPKVTVKPIKVIKPKIKKP